MSHLLSFGFSIAVHLLMLTILLLSMLSFRPKKEEVKVVLLDFKSEKPAELVETNLSEDKPLKNLEKKEDRKSIPKQVSKKEDSLNEAEETLLRERLKALKEKRAKEGELPEITEEEERVLQKRLAALKKASFQETNNYQAPPSPPKVVQDLPKEYLMLIRRKLQANFEVPIYLRAKTDLLTKVMISVNERGYIIDYTFIQRSVSAEFDRAVERCLKISNPLPIDRPIKIIIEFRGTGVTKIS